MKVHEIIAENLVKTINEGVIPWERGWNNRIGKPKNFKRNSEYRGVNLISLMSTAHAYSSNLFLSFKEAESYGLRINKGERSHMITYYCNNTVLGYDKDDKDIIEKKITFLRYFNVFNLEQCDKAFFNERVLNRIKEISDSEKNCVFVPEEKAEQIISNYIDCPKIITNNSTNKVKYDENSHTISTPPKEAFYSVSNYYQAIFEQLIHCSGKHLGRNTYDMTDEYKKKSEELVMEIGAAFLLNECNIAREKNINNIASKCKAIIDYIKQDSRKILWDLSRAQKAFDYITNFKYSAKE